MSTFEIKRVVSAADLAEAARLMEAYKAYLGLEIFANPAQRADEVLPGPYGAADAGILLGLIEGKAEGVVAFKGLGEGISEMKRLYVTDAARGTGLGRALAEAVLEAATEAGHRRMVLDTLARLTAACRLYESLGFTLIPRYNDNPVEGVVFYGVDL